MRPDARTSILRQTSTMACNSTHSFTCTYQSHNQLLLLLLLLLIAPHLPLYAASEDLTDREALLAFKSAVRSDPQGALSSWGAPGVPVCSWTGVYCNGTTPGRVNELDLSGRGIEGTVSAAISNLSYLSVLDLSHNAFTGSIPGELGRLSFMRQLSFAYNSLTGPIPPELAALNRIVYLDMGSNRFSGPLPEGLFCNWTVLQYVDMSNNSLEGAIPITPLCYLPELHFILLWSNRLTGPIPAALANSTRLQWLDIESNFLTGHLPADVLRATPMLEILYLSYNNLSAHAGNTDLRPFFAALAENCPRLRELELAGNGLGGVIPPDVIGNLSVNLVQFHLEENRIRGPVPPDISGLLNLTYLNLSNNALNGTIPPELSRLRKLEQLYLSNNLLSGPIPPELGDTGRLGLLDLSGNNLSGSIPPSLSNLSQLRKLLLHHNALTGPIPTSLGDCSNLEILDLSYNSLSGTIPGTIAGLVSLKIYLNVSNNHLEGSIPMELSKMDMIMELDLSSNRISGDIPPQLGSCVALEYLNLSGNQLVGPLPAPVGRLPYLKALDVSSNQLAGPLPDTLRASTTLKRLNVSFNSFSGYVPHEGALATLSADSFLGNPDLCGSFPGIPRLCRAQRSKQRHQRRLIGVLLPVLMTVAGAIPFVMACLLMRRSPLRFLLDRAVGITRHDGDGEQGAAERDRDYPKISYRQLMEATNAFGQANLVGSGRFGHVYKGVLRDQTPVAVKVLDPDRAGDLISASGSFKRECEVLKRTRHRNLIRIITTCSKPDFRALVLPLMPNGNLDDYLYGSGGGEGSCLDLEQVVSIAGDIAQGMAYLHHYSPVKVVHCDLKPSNVLLDQDMTAIVADFGISRLVRGGVDEAPETASANSTTGLLCGSVGYIAPEYGLGGQPSTQGDVYSYGVLLLELITGKRPTDVLFQEASTLQDWVRSHYPQVLDAIIQEPLLREKDCRPDGPTMPPVSSAAWKAAMMDLIELGLVCAHHNPSMRPTMMDVAHEIGQLKEDLSRHHQHHHQPHGSSDPAAPEDEGQRRHSHHHHLLHHHQHRPFVLVDTS